MFTNLDIEAVGTGVKIFNAALIRFQGVAISVSANVDKVNVSADGCHGCNVVLGSDNAALVVEDTFWLWAEDSSFIFSPTVSAGQRPAVILRGTDKDGHDKSVNTVYLVLFSRVVIAGGGVQYQVRYPRAVSPAGHTAHSARRTTNGTTRVLADGARTPPFAI